jgi:hypothetical protein
MLEGSQVGNFMKQYSLLYFLVVAFLAGCGDKKPDKAEEKEWIALFNGKDLQDWIIKMNHYESGVDSVNTFRVEDGMVRVSYEDYGDNFRDRFAHLYYKKPFSYYHLVVEYRFTGKFQETAPDYARINSGVMLHSQDPKTILKDQPWPIAVEFQFLGGLGDGKPRPTGNMCSPGTEVFYKGQMFPQHCLESSSKTYDGEQWVRAEAIVLGDSLITHIINGDTVLQYTKPQMGDQAVQAFDSTVWQPGKLINQGYIALQSEGHPVDFRKAELLNLKGCMDREASNYKSYYIKSDPGSCKY